MSAAIHIPGKNKRLHMDSPATPTLAGSSSSSSSSGSSSSYHHTRRREDRGFGHRSLRAHGHGHGYGHGGVQAFPPPHLQSAKDGTVLRRRDVLLGSALAKTEHTVVNVGSGEVPRLITCVKAGQGFDWNLDIFLPSYADHPHVDLEHKPDPVADIIVTDEEMATMFPS